MKKLLIAILAAALLTGCVDQKPKETTVPTQAVGTPVVPGPQEMPEKPPQNTLPPGEDNIPDKTHTQ